MAVEAMAVVARVLEGRVRAAMAEVEKVTEVAVMVRVRVEEVEEVEEVAAVGLAARSRGYCSTPGLQRMRTRLAGWCNRRRSRNSWPLAGQGTTRCHTVQVVMLLATVLVVPKAAVVRWTTLQICSLGRR
jgi:hypothetical protein